MGISLEETGDEGGEIIGRGEGNRVGGEGRQKREVGTEKEGRWEEGKEGRGREIKI